MFSLFRYVYFTLTQPTYLLSNLPTLTVRKSLTVWAKLVLFFAGLAAFLLLASAVYFVPQLPKLISTQLPFSRLSLHQGKLTSDVVGSFTLATITLDPTSTISDLSASPSGFYLLSDHVAIVSPDHHLDIQAYPTSDFTITKQDSITWLNDHHFQVLEFALLTVLIFVAFNTFFVMAGQLLFVLIWTLGVTIILKLRRTQLPVRILFILSVHAALGSFLVNASTLFSSSTIASVVSIFVFAFLYFQWLSRLQSPKPKPTLI